MHGGVILALLGDPFCVCVLVLSSSLCWRLSVSLLLSSSLCVLFVFTLEQALELLDCSASPVPSN